MKNYKDQFKNAKVGDWVFDLLSVKFCKIRETNNNYYPYKTDYCDIFTIDGLSLANYNFPRFFTLENAKEIISKLELDVEMPKTTIVRYVVCNKKTGGTYIVETESIKRDANNYIVKKVEFEI